MFDTALDATMDGVVSCADALVASIGAERRVVAQRFAAVAQWADQHHPDREPPSTKRQRHGCRAQVGAEGTPPVSAAAIVELGLLLQSSTPSAEGLLRDVLELRHRLPRIWDAVDAGQLDGWKARKVARLTHRLTFEQARLVDGLVLEAVLGLPWGRAQNVVEAKVIAADPAAHAARLEEEENRRFVSTRRRSNAAGLRTVVARSNAGDVARFEAMIAHLASQLAAAGDTDPADIRRAKAFAMLANPALTCLFLAQAHEPSTAAITHDRADTVNAAAKAPKAADACEYAAPEPGPEPAPELELSSPSAVELAAAFGRALRDLGGKAIDRLRPKSVLYLHVAAEAVEGRPGCGVARVEHPADSGPIGIDQLKEWLAHDRVVVKPVVDPTGIQPVDAGEIPVHLREAVHLLAPYETFPYGTLPSKIADLDHPIPYRPVDKGGPPGQTGIHNLGPLGRRHHLVKTFDGFSVHQLAVGLYLWRTPTGHWFQVDHRGTAYLGRYAGRARPAALDTAERLATTGAADTSGMTQVEKRLRDTIVRHVAA